MARTDYGAILSTVIKDTSDAIREAKGTSALISPSDWGSEIRSIVPPWRAKVNSIIGRTATSIVDDAPTIGAAAFYNYPALVSVSFPCVTSIGNGAFYYCSGLTTINFPVTTIVGSNAFYSCSSLTQIEFPSATQVGAYAFGNCTKLVSADFSDTASFESGVFLDSKKLSTLILRSTSVCSLTDIRTFEGTPFASGKAGGTLYVPQALISSYRSASIWSTILGYTNNKILSIESMENN